MKFLIYGIALSQLINTAINETAKAEDFFGGTIAANGVVSSNTGEGRAAGGEIKGSVRLGDLVEDGMNIQLGASIGATGLTDTPESKARGIGSFRAGKLAYVGSSLILGNGADLDVGRRIIDANIWRFSIGAAEADKKIPSIFEQNRFQLNHTIFGFVEDLELGTSYIKTSAELETRLNLGKAVSLTAAIEAAALISGGSSPETQRTGQVVINENTPTNYSETISRTTQLVRPGYDLSGHRVRAAGGVQVRLGETLSLNGSAAYSQTQVKGHEELLRNRKGDAVEFNVENVEGRVGLEARF